MQTFLLNIRKFFIAILLLAIYIPFIYIILSSFNVNENMLDIELFSLSHYFTFWGNDQLLNSLLNSLIVALISSFLSIVIGFFVSIFTLNHYKYELFIVALMTLPILLPDIIIGLSTRSLFNFIIDRGFLSIILAHTVFGCSFSFLIIYSSIKSTSQELTYLQKASNDLGANSTQQLFKIIIPSLKKTLLSAALICFTLSFDDFLVTFFNIGNFETFPIFLSNILRRQFIPTDVAVIATLLIISSSILLIYSETIQKEDLS